jgi:hypothetical protein
MPQKGLLYVPDKKNGMQCTPYTKVDRFKWLDSWTVRGYEDGFIFCFLALLVGDNLH